MWFLGVMLKCSQKSYLNQDVTLLGRQYKDLKYFFNEYF